jgi:hypothetical protein
VLSDRTIPRATESRQRGGSPRECSATGARLVRHDQCDRNDDIASVRAVEFSRALRNDVLAGDITLSIRLWKQPRVKQDGRYPVGLGEIEVDAIELVPFAAVTAEDVRRAGEPDRETLRQRAAHAGPIDEYPLARIGLIDTTAIHKSRSPRAPTLTAVWAKRSTASRSLNALGVSRQPDAQQNASAKRPRSREP